MSGIFGCLFLDGRPMTEAFVAPMRRAMQAWGPDGLATVSAPSAVMGFGLLAVAPEARHATMPFRGPQGETLFTAVARLDNREELCDHFDLSASERPEVTDERLAQLAWERWGEGAPGHLLGDWALAAWDGVRRRLFLARDQLGTTSLFHVHRSSLFAFSSDPESLLTLDGVERRLSEAHLLSYLAWAPLAAPEETYWQDLRTVLPGTALSVTPDGVTTLHHWDPPASAPLTGLRDEDCLGLFLDHYRAAVKVRTRSSRPIGATLSAGLDSSSVAALAAQELAQGGGRLTTFTARPLGPCAHLAPGSLTDEWPLASLVAVRFPNMDPVAIDAAAVSPLAGLARALQACRFPQLSPENLYWLVALHEAARARGIGVLLTGQMGNITVSWGGGRDRILRLAMAGHWGAAARAMAEWRRQHGRSWFRTLAGQVVMPLWRKLPALRGRSREADPIEGTIRAEAAARFGLPGKLDQLRRDGAAARSEDIHEERCRFLVKIGQVAGTSWSLFGAGFGLEVRDPTADLRLVEFCLQVPEEQYVRQGRTRMLLRRAMAGILPPEVLDNPLRGRQAADLPLRLLDQPRDFEALASRFAANPDIAALVDVDRLRALWRELAQGPAPERTRMLTWTLLRFCMCGCFIERQGHPRLGT